MQKLRSNDNEGLRTEGIFRVPGDSVEMREMRMRLNQGADAREVLAGCHNVHSAAGLLKMYFRELREPLLSFALYSDFVSCAAAMGAPSQTADISTLCALIQRLPPSHYALLQHLVAFLSDCVAFATESRMGVGNVAAVFAPNLLRAETESLDNLADTGHVVNTLAACIYCYRRIFAMSEPTPLAQPALSQRSSSVGVQDRAHSLSAQLAARASFEAAPQITAAFPLASGPAPAEPRWYYLNEQHEQHGPVDWPSLQRLFAEGQLAPDTFLFSDGLTDWTPASNIDLSGTEPHRA